MKKEESKNVEGPPVYYPPGVELFNKKEEAMSQQQVILLQTFFLFLHIITYYTKQFL